MAVESSIVTRPTFEWEDAKIAASSWGSFDLVKMLPSERDQNFLLSSKNSSIEEKVVFKVHNPSDSPDFVDCQNQSLELANERGAKCQKLLRTLHDKQKTTTFTGKTAIGDGPSCLCRMLSFLPGRPLGDAVADTRDDAAGRTVLWEKVGQAVGTVTAALLEFDHPAAHREFVWDLRNAEQVILAHADDVRSDRLPLLHGFLHQYRESVVPVLAQLRMSVVHNDPNDYNLVVDESGDVGILDFGDMMHSYTCADAAICIAYLLFHCPDEVPLVDSVLPFVRSFHACCPLTLAEADALFGLAVMRVCTSVCMSAYQSQLEPDNEYLLISAGPAWKLLERLAGCEGQSESPSTVFRRACGFAAS